MAATNLSPPTNPPRIQQHCTGCGRCVAACRSRALSLETERPDGFGSKRAVIAAGRCTGCGGCLPACLWQALELEAPLPGNPRSPLQP